MPLLMRELCVAAKIGDFWDFTMIPLESLQPILLNFILYRPQFHAFMDNFKIFPDIVATNGDWSIEDKNWFSEIVVNSQFVTKYFI